MFPTKLIKIVFLKIQSYNPHSPVLVELLTVVYLKICWAGSCLTSFSGQPRQSYSIQIKILDFWSTHLLFFYFFLLLMGALSANILQYKNSMIYYFFLDFQNFTKMKFSGGKI